MGLSTPRTVFGICSIAPYNVSTREFYGVSRVLGGSTFALSGETVELLGGCSKYPWQVEDGTISAELAMTMREYPDWAMEVFLGKAPTANTGETTGDVSTIVDAYGTSMASATTGIASIAAKAGDEADLKFGKYVVKAVSATTVDVYCSTGADFARGTDTSYENDDLKINSAPLTVTDAGGVTEIADYGLEITGGSGTVALVNGDTATFEVRPINSANIEAVFGANSDTYPEFGCIITAQKQGSGKLFEIDIYRAKAIGMPFGMTANEFSEAEITAKAFYDSARNGVFSIRSIDTV